MFQLRVKVCQLQVKIVSFEKNCSASGKNVSVSSTNVSSTCTSTDCGFQQNNSGVILSCLNCFPDGGRLYHFEYGVSNSFFFSRVRSGTCTTAQSDSPEAVIHRAMYLLQNGFGDYVVLSNNCEDFALYCKIVFVHREALGSNGQAASVIGAPSAASVSLSLKLFMSSPAGLVVSTAGAYWVTRYASDVGVRIYVTKVKVEELNSFRGRKSSKKSIYKNHSDTREVMPNQTNTPAKKWQGYMQLKQN